MMKKSRQIVSEFAKCVMALSELLEANEKLDDLENLVIDDHLVVLQLSYNNWKRRARQINGFGEKH